MQGNRGHFFAICYGHLQRQMNPAPTSNLVQIATLMTPHSHQGGTKRLMTQVTEVSEGSRARLAEAGVLERLEGASKEMDSGLCGQGAGPTGGLLSTGRGFCGTNPPPAPKRGSISFLPSSSRCEAAGERRVGLRRCQQTNIKKQVKVLLATFQSHTNIPDQCYLGVQWKESLENLIPV